MNDDDKILMEAFAMKDATKLDVFFYSNMAKAIQLTRSQERQKFLDLIDLEIKKIEKGCHKEFIENGYFKCQRVCGCIEDLKHSSNIMYCPLCSAKLNLLEELRGKI